jgi:hypothetical protein
MCQGHGTPAELQITLHMTAVSAKRATLFEHDSEMAETDSQVY